MVRKNAIIYPHGIVVIGKSLDNNQSERDFRVSTANSFQGWLEENLTKNNSAIALGLSMLYKTEKEWKKSAKSSLLKRTYEEHLDMLELLAGQNIEVIVGF